MKQIDSNADLDVKIQAHALLGRVYAKQGKSGPAEKEYNTVKSTWTNPAAMQKQLDAQGGSDYAKGRRLAKVLTAVGEALYYFADRKREKAESYAFPEYSGSGEAADVDKFIKDKVKGWVDQKGPAIKEAEQAYLEIVKLKPAPPPMWVIKAGAAVGNMYGNYVAQFRAAPYPKDWDRDGFVPGIDPPLLWAELKSTYLANLDMASEKQKGQAKGAYITCLDYSVRYQYFDEDSRTCEEWLSKNFPAEFHLIDEFRGAPTRVNSGLDERPQALNMDGSAVVADTREAEEKAAQKEGGKKKEEKKED